MAKSELSLGICTLEAKRVHFPPTSAFRPHLTVNIMLQNLLDTIYIDSFRLSLVTHYWQYLGINNGCIQ